MEKAGNRPGPSEAAFAYRHATLSCERCTNVPYSFSCDARRRLGRVLVWVCTTGIARAKASGIKRFFAVSLLEKGRMRRGKRGIVSGAMLIDAMKCHATSGNQLDDTDRSSPVVSIVKITYLWKERARADRWSTQSCCQESSKDIVYVTFR